MKVSLIEHKKLTDLFETNQFIVAGGAASAMLLSSDINDFDCFFSDPNECILARENLEKKGWRELDIRRRSVQLYHSDKTYKIDLINSDFEDPMKIISEFDLLDCCHYFGESGIVHSLNGAMSALLSQTVVINKLKTPYSTLTRIAKRKKKGWKVEDSQLLQLAQLAMNVSWGYKDEQEYL